MANNKHTGAAFGINRAAGKVSLTPNQQRRVEANKRYTKDGAAYYLTVELLPSNTIVLDSGERVEPVTIRPEDLNRGSSSMPRNFDFDDFLVAG